MRMRNLLLAPAIGCLGLLASASAHAGGYGVSSGYGYGYGAGFGVSYGSGCGGCQPPVVYAPPPPPPPPVYSGCSPCAPAYGNPYYARQPIYVVNQGPYYSGAGIMVPSLTWSKGSHTGGYPYVAAHPGYYDGGPYADPLGHRYVRRYGYHEQVPAGYTYAPSGPRIVTRSYERETYAPRVRRYDSRDYAPRVRTRYYEPPRRRGVVVRANAEVRHIGRDRIDVRLYRKAPPRRAYRSPYGK